MPPTKKTCVLNFWLIWHTSDMSIIWLRPLDGCMLAGDERKRKHDEILLRFDLATFLSLWLRPLHNYKQRVTQRRSTFPFPLLRGTNFLTYCWGANNLFFFFRSEQTIDYGNHLYLILDFFQTKMSISGYETTVFCFSIILLDLKRSFIMFDCEQSF